MHNVEGPLQIRGHLDPPRVWKNGVQLQSFSTESLIILLSLSIISYILKLICNYLTMIA